MARPLQGLAMLRMPSLLGLLLALSPPLAEARTCADLAAEAGTARGLPDGLLPGIARVESGGDAGWPWTLNVEGRGFHFDTREEALAHLRQELDAGKRSIDIGCMQINYRWHGENFASVEEMIDPVANTAYAARYLGELKVRFGSWDAATRRYHSPDPVRGANYIAAVERAAAPGRSDGTHPPRLSATATVPPDRPPTGRDDRFAGAAPLVPMDPATPRADAVLPVQSLPVIPASGAHAARGRAPSVLRTRTPAHDGQRILQLRAALAPHAHGSHP